MRPSLGYESGATRRTASHEYHRGRLNLGGDDLRVSSGLIRIERSRDVLVTDLVTLHADDLRVAITVRKGGYGDLEAGRARRPSTSPSVGPSLEDCHGALGSGSDLGGKMQRHAPVDRRRPSLVARSLRAGPGRTDPAPPRLPHTGRSARRGGRVKGARRASRSDGAVWGSGSPHCAALDAAGAAWIMTGRGSCLVSSR